MIDISKYEVVGLEHAIRGMRNSRNSWDKSDSEYKCPYGHPTCAGCGDNFCVGENDLSLMKKLCKAGTDDRKFMRMIVVYADITAPMYWWKEFDTYKVGTVRNSCSTMYKITDKEFELEDFSYEKLMAFKPGGLPPVLVSTKPDPDIQYSSKGVLNLQTDMLNELRMAYLKTDVALREDMEECNRYKLQANKKELWYNIIQLLPSSYNTKSTVMLNYEVLANMYFARKDHKLDEWHEFCDWALTLPYFKQIIGVDE